MSVHLLLLSNGKVILELLQSILWLLPSSVSSSDVFFIGRIEQASGSTLINCEIFRLTQWLFTGLSAAIILLLILVTT